MRQIERVIQEAGKADPGDGPFQRVTGMFFRGGGKSSKGELKILLFVLVRSNKRCRNTPEHPKTLHRTLCNRNGASEVTLPQDFVLPPCRRRTIPVFEKPSPQCRPLDQDHIRPSNGVSEGTSSCSIETHQVVP
jgi:hypothetical protein